MHEDSDEEALMKIVEIEEIKPDDIKLDESAKRSAVRVCREYVNHPYLDRKF